MPRPIDRYAAIGEGRSVALVSDVGSIDWLCWPRVDSASMFAALLDEERGGYFRIAPTETFASTRRYVEGTNVLVTTMRTASGAIELIDFMPATDATATLSPEREIIRRVRCISGTVELAIEIDPRHNYGASPARARGCAHGVRWESREGALYARADVPLMTEGTRAFANVTLGAGGRIDLSLSHAVHAPAVLPTLGPRVDSVMAQTVSFFRAWSAQSSYRGPYRAAVERSALALKLLCYAPSGAIIAAPTTSLPERIGGPSNWDYRFCWLRDASMTARALFGLGFVDEAEAFVSWLLHATRLTWPRLSVLYDVHGRKPPNERTLPLSGYQGSLPVRIGNAARDQLQLDLYGEVIDATAQLARSRGGLDRPTQELIIGLAETALRVWHLPDHGIWEPREAPSHHTHSRLLCWVALDRMLGLEADGHVKKLRHRDRYIEARAAIRRDIETRAFRNGTYVGELDGSELDATSLLLSFYGFEPPDSPRMRATHAAIRRSLGTRRGLRRYAANEGTFAICGFWEVDYLARAGYLVEADALFRAMCATANDIGLLAEETDPETGALLGNFPQGFSHIGLINAAMTLEQARTARRRPTEVRA
jgi:GH15 family glucan-1,4-alpha-glucosidase